MSLRQGRRSNGEASAQGEAMSSGEWTVERVALLTKLWAAGETANAIAAQLGDGMTRSAVLGKIFRLRLGGGTAARVSHASEGAAARNDKRGAGHELKPKFAASPQDALVPKSPEAPLARRRAGGKRGRDLRSPSPAGKSRMTLLDLTNESCRSASCGAAPTRIAKSGSAGTPKVVPRSRPWRKNWTGMPPG